jgi:hypothetical protein
VLKVVSPNLPLWPRLVLLVAAVGLASGASLFAYRYYTRPVTLSVVVGSIDGEAARLRRAAPLRFRQQRCGRHRQASVSMACELTAHAINDVGLYLRKDSICSPFEKLRLFC